MSGSRDAGAKPPYQNFWRLPGALPRTSRGPTSITPHFSTTNAASRNDCRTSAIAGILFREFEAAREMKIIHDSDRCLMSVANFVELCIVIEGQLGAGAGRECDMSFWRAGIAIEAVTIEQG